jgi:hypothetical protein
MSLDVMQNASNACVIQDSCNKFRNSSIKQKLNGHSFYNRVSSLLLLLAFSSFRRNYLHHRISQVLYAFVVEEYCCLLGYSAMLSAESQPMFRRNILLQILGRKISQVRNKHETGGNRRWWRHVIRIVLYLRTTELIRPCTSL